MKKAIIKNYKFLIFLITLFVILNIRLPYYIDSPGGISNIADKIIINGYETKGSFNLAYVTEYKATIPALIISYFDKDSNILREDEVLLENEKNSTYLIRDKLSMKEAISNAIYVAYNYANKKIEEISNKTYISYIFNDSKSDLQIEDEILEINNIKINSKKEISSVINSKNVGDKVHILVKNNNKTFSRYAYIIDEDSNKKIGILVNNIKEYNTIPKINIDIGNNEYGPSGGLMMGIYIYNTLVKEDISKGNIIVGTGTIDLDGKVGSIGGVEYKLKSAVKSNADVFIVPSGDNYEEAMKLKNKNNYNIDIIGVSTFEETLNYLKRM